jgi:hypothetical protein
VRCQSIGDNRAQLDCYGEQTLKSVIHRFLQVLLTSEVPFCRQNQGVAEKELDLFQLTSVDMAELCALLKMKVRNKTNSSMWDRYRVIFACVKVEAKSSFVALRSYRSYSISFVRAIELCWAPYRKDSAKPHMGNCPTTSSP